jgi:predicted Zn finger-like uncharacterized protein
MLIVCPNCGTSYMLDQVALGAAGRNVRCARCKTSWFAGGPEAAPEPVAAVAEQAAPEAPAPVRAARAKAPDSPPPEEAAPFVPPPAEPEPPAAKVPEIPAASPQPAPEAKAPPVEPPAAPPEPAAPAEAAHAVEPPAEPAAVEILPPIVEAPPLAPAAVHETEAEQAESEAADSFVARRRVLQARRKKKSRSSRWTAVILVLVACNVALVGARNEVVRYLPQTASLFAAIGLPVNLRNLKFENVKLSTEDLDGMSMLTVQGSIASEAGKAVGVPRLRFAVRNASGQEVYSWTMAPPKSVLEPGAKIDFRSQVPVPKGEATDVMVRFLSAQDAGAK